MSNDGPTLSVGRPARSFEAAEYGRASLELWQALAPGWERWREQLAESLSPVRDWLISKLAPRPGETLLELGAGAGDTGFAAAAILGERGRLIASDFAPAMVEVARRRGTEVGRRNVEYRLIDAERMDLQDDSVDGVLCQNGFMLMRDPAAALAETRRVLRRGGRLALSVWGAPERNPWASIGSKILIENGYLPPSDSAAPGVFGMASEERTHALLEGAGFTAVRTEEVAMRWTFRDLADYERWAMDVGGPFAKVLHGLSEAERKPIRSQLGAAFAPFVTDRGYELPGAALCAVARAPHTVAVPD